ncbi:hypothetical protein PFFCH_05756 [Plasmodium falciparum FCH/4]|uniref:Surface antigen n=1 Tax=Plasmodium falciparum FCH/4 TaxID=1036724 RepID=A0A024VDL7_PLAFA|nr:hypothetical protein PFFCH_05756 [Plasmodium falciparum FCH/4]
MKEIMHDFDRQTSQRFEEYNERMNKNRQKCKEQCDRDIKNIILKDKMEKSLAEKVEKGCLRCGCGLGGVAAGVGIIGPVAVNVWEIGAKATAIELATKEGIDAGIKAAIVKIKNVSAFVDLKNVSWTNFINDSNYNSISGLVEAVKEAMASINKPCISNSHERACSGLSHDADYFISSAVQAGQDATVLTTESAKTANLGEVTTASSNAYSAIGYSVIAIMIIVLVMIIIYLILRYRRTKKMNKKQQYTKLLNQ